MNKWQAFWHRLMSPQTARFVLALLSLDFAAGGALYLMSGHVLAANMSAATFALGNLFGLAQSSFGYYFGSTARNDEKPAETKIVNPPGDPAHVTIEDEKK